MNEQPIEPETIRLIKQGMYNRQGEGNRTLSPNEFRISSIAYCSRRIFYDKTVPDQAIPFDDTTHGIFNSGHAFHEYIQQVLYPKDKIVKAEHYVSYPVPQGDFVLTGHIDLWVKDEQGRDKIIDIKTANDHAFIHKQKKISPYYYTQVQCYTSIMMFKLQEILYIKKNDFTMFVQPLPYNIELFVHTLFKLGKLMIRIEENVLPDPDWLEEWECNYCPYRNICSDKGNKSKNTRLNGGK